MSDYKNLILKQTNRVATVCLNRPQVLNAMSIEMLMELEDVLSSLASDAQTRIVILTGAGSAFSAGLDIRDFADTPARNGTFEGFYDRPGHTIHTLISDMPKIVIARINGDCYTGALEIALACDLIVASESAKIGDTHTRWGLLPRWGLSQRLPRRVGILKARELSYTASLITGSEAYRLGLVNHAPPVEEIDAVIDDLCQVILKNSSQAIAAYKQLYKLAENVPLDDGIETEFEAEFSIDDTQARLDNFLHSRSSGR